MFVRKVPVCVIIIGMITVFAHTAAIAATSPVPAAPTTTRAWTAKIVEPMSARSAPGSGRVVAHLATTAKIFGGPNVLLVLGATKHKGVEYVRVELPTRPNQSSAWVVASQVLLSTTPYRITVNLGQRSATLTKSGHTVASTKAVVGAPATPTPTGLYAVSEVVPQPSGSVLGAYVLATTAHSDVHFTFDGGDGEVGLHGYEQLGAPLGTASSNGCVRLPESFVYRLVDLAKAGTPINIIS